MLALDPDCLAVVARTGCGSKRPSTDAEGSRGGRRRSYFLGSPFPSRSSIPPVFPLLFLSFPSNSVDDRVDPVSRRAPEESRRPPNLGILDNRCRSPPRTHTVGSNCSGCSRYTPSLPSRGVREREPHHFAAPVRERRFNSRNESR